MELGPGLYNLDLDRQFNKYVGWNSGVIVQSSLFKTSIFMIYGAGLSDELPEDTLVLA